MDRADPSGVGRGPPLSVGDRDHRDRRKSREDNLMLRQVKSAMERGHKWCGLTGKQGERIVIEMEVQQIEIVSPVGKLARAWRCAMHLGRGPSRPDAMPSANMVPGGPKFANRRLRTRPLHARGRLVRPSAMK